uniref:Uncharacterized protein n=1 Tax=Amphiprion ocellaris TaxID=80972 RepID=A0AAQ5YLJ6_AMPOC
MQPNRDKLWKSFNLGISKEHLNFESISSSGFASFHCGQEHEEGKSFRKGLDSNSLASV